MKTTIKVSILALSSAILFTACGGESPKDATEKFYNSLKNGDVATFKKYSTDSTQRLMGLTFTMGCFDKDLKRFKVVDVKENSKVNATVIVEEKTKDNVKNNILELEKLEDQWKVSIN